MKKKVKAMAKDALVIGATGVGLGMLGSLGGGEGANAAIGKLGTGLGTAGSVVMMGHTVGFMEDAFPKKKKKDFW